MGLAHSPVGFGIVVLRLAGLCLKGRETNEGLG